MNDPEENPKRKPQFSGKVFDDTINVTPNPPLKELGVLLASALGIIFGVYLALGLILELLIPTISVKTENWMWDKLGKDLPASITRNAEDQSAQEERLQALLASLPDSVVPADYDFKIHIIKKDDINAMALPGGNIVLTTGLLERIKSENALVFVLGHELGHFKNRDHIRGMGRGMASLLIGVALLGQSSSTVDIISGMTLTTDLVFSRKAERKADEWGLKTLKEHYGHTGGASEFFELLLEEDRFDFIPAILSTHPGTRNRLEEMKSRAEALNAEEKPLKSWSYP